MMLVAPIRPTPGQLPILTAQGVWRTETGFALGTTFRIRYLTAKPDGYAVEIDALLRAFNRSLSLYDPESELCRFNRADSHQFESLFFYPVLKRAAELHQLTAGAFDPTVFPLVEAYGFGPKGRMVKPVLLNRLLSIVGLPYVAFNQRSVWKLKKGVQLDFNAIAKGYAVDCIGALLEANGVGQYMIEIGGEIRCRGRNEQDQPWCIGIANPLADHQLHAVLPLTNRAMATSGNYLNGFQQDGQMYGHIVNPKTGLMEQSSLLSATVLASDCMTADALATAFMVMGVRKTQTFLTSNPANDAYLIVRDEAGMVRSYRTAACTGTPTY